MRNLKQSEILAAMQRAMGATQLTAAQTTAYNLMAADAAEGVARSALWREFRCRGDLDIALDEAWWQLPSNFKPEPLGSVLVYWKADTDDDFGDSPLDLLNTYRYHATPYPPVVDAEVVGTLTEFEIVAVHTGTQATAPEYWLHSTAIKAEEAGTLRVVYFRNLIESEAVAGWHVPRPVAEAIKAEAVARVTDELGHISADSKQARANRKLRGAKQACAFNTVSDALQLEAGYFKGDVEGSWTEGGRE